MAGEPQPDTSVSSPEPPATALPGASPGGATARAQDGYTMLLIPGARPVPDYELVRLLGRGGCGEVWRAKGPGGFDVALKFIPLGGPEARVELRSLELFKSIHHAHLLTMFGAWHRDGYLIVAMELADRTLLQRAAECVEHGLPGIPREELLEYMREAAKGLDYLNETRHPSTNGDRVGIQHKDVKPQNLLLVGGVVKVADFGLAQVLERTVASASGGLTPAYAAPEFFGGRATRWSDQYSLAVSYCHLRGGRLPFTGSAVQMMAGHTQQAPDLTMVPEGERPALEKALAKEPENRWPSCRLFVEALAADWAIATGPAAPGPARAPLEHPGTALMEQLRGHRTAPAPVALDQLRSALADTDGSALLVPLKILRRVIKGEYGVPYLLTEVPHERCWYFDRQVLYRYVEQEELLLDPDHRLPATVILLAAPTPEQLQSDGLGVLLARVWRQLFHARVHLALQARHQEGRLTPADARARIETIGATEFREVRSVLQQENCLLPPGDDLNAYIEFAAVYLELRHFRRNLLRSYFPAIQDYDAIEALLAQDLDAAALFTRTRLPGAPEPVVRTNSSDESNTYYWKLIHQAERAERDRDLVRAAILGTRATRVAQGLLAHDAQAAAQRDLRSLIQQLQEALKLTPDEAAQWLRVLPTVLEKADQGYWPVEAKLLYDLQKIGQEHRQKLIMLDLVEWALTAGKRPVQRPLNMLQIVHDTNYLRTAQQRLTTVRVADDDRKRLGTLIQNALAATAGNLRGRIRPILLDAFDDVGLKPSSPTDQVALDKIIEELLDQVTEKGYFTFSDLRDSISANQLKLPDLNDPYSLLRGDPLRRLDRRLTAPLEGVYRRGDFYLRWLESASSLFSGTTVGRFVTLNFFLPFLCPYLLIHGVQLVWNEWLKGYPGLVFDLPDLTILPVGVLAWCLIHFEGVRDFFVEAGRRAARGLRFVLYELPLRVWRVEWPRRILQSWPVLLLYWYVVQPLAVWGVLALCWPGTFLGPFAAPVTVFGASLLLNSYPGMAVGEAIMEAVTLIYTRLRVDALRGLLRLIDHSFKQLTEGVESVLYTVDEWMRFRTGEGRFKTALRLVLGVFWFPVRYLIRLYFITLIEPTLNPLKLPLSILAAKFIYLIPNYAKLMIPASAEHKSLIIDPLTPHTGHGLAVFIGFMVVPTLWLLPSAVAFLVWEMTGNWRLFRANRSTSLQPVVVGRYGETVLQLLKPGAHSGTIPRLFADLRHAEVNAYRTSDWRAARRSRLALDEVARSFQVFVEREFITLLERSKSWSTRPLRVAAVVPSCTRIRIELAHAGHPETALVLALEEQAGWLIGGVQQAGWLPHVTVDQRRTLTAALAGLYKLAGVDFVSEQLAAVLPAAPGGYELTNRRCYVWTDRDESQAVVYDLREVSDRITAIALDKDAPPAGPEIKAADFFFSRVPITWERWESYWKSEESGAEPPPLLLGAAVHLLPGGTA